MRYATNQNKCTTLVPNNVARGVDFRERRVAPYNPSVERARLLRYALLGITARCAAQPREGVAHLSPR